MEIKKFENSLIAFDFESEIVNATDMLRAYPEKKINDFLRLKSTKDYISFLESKTVNPVLIVKHGGSGHGTWMTRKLSYELAGWLDIKFKDFVYEVFDKFLIEKLESQQRQLDYFWDRSDQNDLYPKLKFLK
jgi:hypothetical protein